MVRLTRLFNQSENAKGCGAQLFVAAELSFDCASFRLFVHRRLRPKFNLLPFEILLTKIKRNDERKLLTFGLVLISLTLRAHKFAMELLSMLSAHFGGSPKVISTSLPPCEIKVLGHFVAVSNDFRGAEAQLAERSSGEEEPTNEVHQAAAVVKFKRNKPKESAAAFHMNRKVRMLSSDVVVSSFEMSRLSKPVCQT
ncbi:MAG: hypothetical protein ACTS4V_00535 [Candidatus Hodgkinia cicadicola]